MALFPGLPRWASARKVKPIWILLKQETVSGSGISWAICKSAPHSRQMQHPHHSVFYRPDALPATQPTASILMHLPDNMRLECAPTCWSWRSFWRPSGCQWWCQSLGPSCYYSTHKQPYTITLHCVLINTNYTRPRLSSSVLQCSKSIYLNTHFEKQQLTLICTQFSAKWATV